MPLKTYNALVRQAFKDACPNLSEDMLSDRDAVFAAIPWLPQWHAKTLSSAVATWRDSGKFKKEVQKAVKPMVDMVRFLRRISSHPC